MLCSGELDVYYELSAMECVIWSDESAANTAIIQKCISKLGESFIGSLVITKNRFTSRIFFNQYLCIYVRFEQ